MQLLCGKEEAILQDGGGSGEKILRGTRWSRGGLVLPYPLQSWK